MWQGYWRDSSQAVKRQKEEKQQKESGRKEIVEKKRLIATTRTFVAFVGVDGAVESLPAGAAGAAVAAVNGARLTHRAAPTRAAGARVLVVAPQT